MSKFKEDNIIKIEKAGHHLIAEKLIDLIIRNSIEIRVEKSKYCGREHSWYDEGIDDVPPIIHLVLDKFSYSCGSLSGEFQNLRKKFLIENLSENLDHLVILAHEFGHHPPLHDDYTDIIKRKNEGHEVSVEDWAKVIEEETQAWSRGRGALEQLGWTEWERFDRVKNLKLLSYTSA